MKIKFSKIAAGLGLAAILFTQFMSLNSCAKTTARANAATRQMQFTYAFTVKNIPAGASQLEIWAPAPQSDDRQIIENLTVTSNYPHTFETEPEYGNSIIHVQSNGALPESLEVAMNFSVTRIGYHILQNKDKSSGQSTEAMLQRALAPDRLVPLDGKIADELAKVVRAGMTPLEKARTIYDHVVETMTYDKSGTGWGRGDAIYACDVRKGNCTDFHSLFIGMMRASQIPARFVIGFPVPENVTEGTIAGYHCWAEFYLEDMGWLPVDASEASKNREKQNNLFGGLDAHRVQFTVGRDILIPSMGTAGEPLNYFIYPQVRIDGQAHTEIARRVSFKEVANAVD